MTMTGDDREHDNNTDTTVVSFGCPLRIYAVYIKPKPAMCCFRERVCICTLYGPICD